MNPLVFAILGALSFGFWTVFHKLASPYINQVFGAIVVSATAVVAGLIVLLPRLKDTELFSDYRGVVFLAITGVLAFFIDFFALKAYSGGLPVTTGGPIIIGGSIAVASIIGIFLGDPISSVKVLALLLLVAGATLLAYIG